MPRLIYISHPEVVIAPEVPVPEWSLSPDGVAAMRRFCRGPVVGSVGTVFASTETKATEAAAILAEHLGLPVRTDPEMGENDRSATGFLPPGEFEAKADAFFARPDASVGAGSGPSTLRRGYAARWIGRWLCIVGATWR